MILKTERLILRPWRATDAADLYRYAKDERVGPVAGWPPHKSVGESAEVIRTVFAQEGVYAVALKEDDVAIGCIGLITGDRSNLHQVAINKKTPATTRVTGAYLYKVTKITSPKPEQYLLHKPLYNLP